MKRWLFILVLTAIIGFFLFQGRQVSVQNLLSETGAAIDSLHGVKVYYNGRVSNVSGRNLTEDGYNLGLKYQCVEFVKRYYYEHYDHKMPDSWGHAKDFFAAGVEDGQVNSRRNLLQFSNPSTSKPEIGDLIVMGATAFNKYGHVAIIFAVGEDYISIIQQNPGPTAASRVQLNLEKKGARWEIEQGNVLGWLRKKQE